MYTHVSGRTSGKRVAAVVGTAVVLALVLVYLPITPSGPLGGGNSGLHLAKKPFTPPAALHIPLTGPVVNLTAGDRVNVTYEYEAVNYTPSLHGMLLRFPSVFGVFTQKNGNLLFITLTDRDLYLNKSGYNNGSTTYYSDLITKSYTLDPTQQPFLTTLKLSTMANTTYGAIELAFRWNYTIWVKANDTTLSSGWSTFGNHAGQESTVTPAQLMLLGQTTPEYTTVGSRFSAQLTGLVSGVDYWVEVEDPFTGISVEDRWDNASVGVSSFDVTILLQDSKGTMAAAPWLVHIHDSHGDILYSIPVYLSDPPTAAIYFTTSPSTCGPVVFNGVAEASGDHQPNMTTKPYSLVATPCAGYTFAGWTQVGGGAQFADSASSSTGVTLIYNTTVGATYIPAFPRG
ncbi:MAG: hypothetical protein WBF81_00155 [Thermoplasmata archaeon]